MENNLDTSPQHEPITVTDASNLEPTLARATPSRAVQPADGEDQSQSLLRAMRSSRRLADQVLRRLEEGLEATSVIWDAPTKTFVERPDFKVRLAAVELYLANTAGLPVQRSENLNITASANPQPNLIESLSRSRAAREALRRALDRADIVAARQAGADKGLGGESA
jgi:hypothetical protein